VQYACQMIQGCPLTTEFFDPCKVLIEGTRCGRVGDKMVLDGQSVYKCKVSLITTTSNLYARRCSSINILLSTIPLAFFGRVLPGRCNYIAKFVCCRYVLSVCRLSSV